MCGIAGLITNRLHLDKHAILNKMLLATKHRGPDHTGVHVHEEVALGMNRLSILDLSAAANQPMYSKDKRFVMVYNGEVYNFKQLREGLMKQGVSFTTHSDTEVVLEMYIRYGEKMLGFIRGMFAFVIWDTLEKKLFGAKDHLGIKPLLYSLQNDTFLFCSELKGILAADFVNHTNLDGISISNYFTIGHTISPHTMLESVKSLKNGHYFTYEHNTFKELSYWQPESIMPFSEATISYKEVVKTVRAQILESVQEQLVSDVPLGVFLSGGLDSGIVTAAMVACGAKQIKTFTIGFDVPNLTIDETDDAQVFADFFQTDHQSIKISDQFIRDNFIDYVSGLDQPSADGLNTYLVSKYTRSAVTVALSGLGPDELFCGYTGFLSFLNRSSFPLQILGSRLLDTTLSKYTIPEKIFSKLYEKVNRKDDVMAYILLLQRNNELFNYQVLAKEFRQFSNYGITKDVIVENYALSNIPINKIRQLYVTQFMVNMLLRDSDAVAMKNSLEVRFPLIDYRLVEYAYKIPMSHLVKNPSTAIASRNYGHGDVKQIIRDAFLQDLPAELFTREKRGFQIPTSHWMQNPLRELIEESIQNPCTLFDKMAVKKAYKTWQNGMGSWKKIWSIFMFDIWYKIHIEKKY